MHARAQRGSDRAAHHDANRADILGALMNEGWKDDAGKPRLDLLPSELVLTIARVLTFSATKCGDRDWERVIAWGACSAPFNATCGRGGAARTPTPRWSTRTSHGVRDLVVEFGGWQDGIVSCSGTWL